MSGYAILLFLHVSGAILIFTGIATLSLVWPPSGWHPRSSRCVP